MQRMLANAPSRSCVSCKSNQEDTRIDCHKLLRAVGNAGVLLYNPAMKLSLPLLLLLGTLAGAACTKAGPPPARNEISEALSQPDVLILDVRSQSEFEGGHVEGAINVPVGELERIKTILPDKDRQIVVHCAAGVRSARASTALAEMGYTRVLDAQTPAAVAKVLGKPLVK